MDLGMLEVPSVLPSDRYIRFHSIEGLSFRSLVKNYKSIGFFQFHRFFLAHDEEQTDSTAIHYLTPWHYETSNDIIAGNGRVLKAYMFTVWLNFSKKVLGHKMLLFVWRHLVTSPVKTINFQIISFQVTLSSPFP